MPIPNLSPQIHLNVTNSLNEDIYSGDLTAQLLPADNVVRAQVITREEAVLCGTQWFDGCFRPQDANCEINWLAKDGDAIKAGQLLCEIRGKARALLTAERSALNLLQTLSGTATKTKQYVDAVVGINVKIMDTRKTLPGLRHAQKYAVRVGGGHNQRFGLYDGILIKENHIAAAGGIKAVLAQAFRLAKPDVSVQIEVENLVQLEEALNAGAKLILLDNFDLAGLRAAVQLTAKRAELEASGGITLTTLRQVALTGVDRISIGALTKDLHAVDLSMRILPH
ncbi:MAG: carboxylating nicotinate-nucleotide diphosphorylase [Gallionella sp.]|nr:carboxylating nicotinate-nucleotide diphosphorylase [Gallionella sp.]